MERVSILQVVRMSLSAAWLPTYLLLSRHYVRAINYSRTRKMSLLCHVNHHMIIIYITSIYFLLKKKNISMPPSLKYLTEVVPAIRDFRSSGFKCMRIYKAFSIKKAIR